MGIFEPLALLALPLLAVIVALYLLRLRRPTAPVGSLRLWDTLTRDREANSVWQRLKWTLLMVLQIVALLALILALARPWALATESVGSNVILVMDVSASMGSRDRDGGQTRLDRAKDRARDIVDAMPGAGNATLISTDLHATIVVPTTSDRGRLKSAIDQLQPQPASTAIGEAMKIAAAVASQRPGSTVWVISDGAFSSVTELAEPISGSVRFVGVGEAQGNQGITALQLLKKGGGLSLFMQVSNSESLTVTRRVDLLADDGPWTARNVAVGPNSTREVEVEDVPLSARVVQAQISGRDDLQIDDRAWAVNRASAPANVLLVSDGNKFLELGLSLLPVVNLYKVSPANYDPQSLVDGLPVDLTVFDAGVPLTDVQHLPAGAVMMIAPPLGNPLVQVSGVMTDPRLIVPGLQGGTQPADDSPNAGGPDPLLRFVDLSLLHIGRSLQLASPSWARAVLGSDSGPLLLAGERDGRNVVVFAFDLHDSDLPLQPAFPLLLRNLVTYLLPLPSGGLPEEVVPGAAVAIPPVSEFVTRIVVEDPAAGEHILTPVGTSSLAYGQTESPGVYYVTQYEGEAIVAQEAFAVNLFSRDESLTPPSLEPGLPRTVEGESATLADERLFRRDLWPLVALGGVLLLVGEWLYSQRVVIRRAITEARARRAAHDAGTGKGQKGLI